MNNYFTLNEIHQQESLWLKTLDYIEANKNIISKFLDDSDSTSRKIIFTGAGTSEFIGNVLAQSFGENFYTIPTTDIVSNPKNYFNKTTKTLLISFARSGNSPESLATIKLADKLIDDVYHIIITCNNKGDISLYKEKSNNSLIIFTPEESNDKGFAMTSSFTCMALAAIGIFNLNKLEEVKKKMCLCINCLNNSKDDLNDFVKTLNAIDIDRLIYLGTSCLKYLGEEASLKYLELTGGKVNTFYNSPLGFRHGPKSIVNNNTMIIIFLSNNKYTRKYEIDLIKEIHSDKTAKALVVLDMTFSNKLKGICDYYFSFKCNDHNLENVFNTFTYVYFAQLLAFHKSVSLGINPDNPCPSGEVNRVVKGVIIHEYN